MEFVLRTCAIFSIMLLQCITGEDCASKKVSIVADIVEDTSNGSFQINVNDLLWHVSILHESEGGGEARFLCSGSLVQRSLVVTAAECVARANLTRLRAVLGLTHLHTPAPHIPTPGEGALVYNVSEKYYPYRENYTVEKDDLAILRLSNVSGGGGRVGGSPRLAVLPASARLSKHCFALGWGHHHSLSENEMVAKCGRPGYKDTAWVSLYQSSKYSHVSLSLRSLLSLDSLLGLANYMPLAISNVIPMLMDARTSTTDDLPPFSEPTCAKDEYAALQAVKMSASGKLRNTTLCPDTGAICLHATATATATVTDRLTHKVDIGSPIYCKIKKPKVAKNCAASVSSQFVLAGVVTSKAARDYQLTKRNRNTTVSVIKATNVTQHSEFILSVLYRKH